MRKLSAVHPCEESLLQNYEELKGKFACKLIHRGKNEKLLNDIPYVPWMDLAIVVFVLLEVSPYGTATVLVRKEHLEIWGLTEAQLSMRRKKIRRFCFRTSFARCGSCFGKSAICSGWGRRGRRKSICTFQQTEKFWSSKYALWGDPWEGGAEAGRELLYSSEQHPWGDCCPGEQSPVKQDLEEMVREINETQVEEEEVLSDRVYYFSRRKSIVL